MMEPEPERRCVTCGGPIGAYWAFGTCVPCLLRSGSAGPAPAQPEDPADPEDPASVTDQIGPYSVLRRISVGGMGEVYEAEQDEPQRRVAIKVIRAGLVGHGVLRRFHQEMQALGAMDHPNIARIYDTGTLPDGRPYFVMEYFEGQPITHYCRDHELGSEERLALFAQVGNAVQHAHQRGVIHRDLTPANVLVAPTDGASRLKLIDFGVAKALAGSPSAIGFETRVGEVVGTPAYMSPEQTTPNSEFDVRSDVYSLGVLLYELLCDCLPFDELMLGGRPPDEIFRLIRECDPPPPSRRLPPSVARRIHADLDSITMKALSKDKAARYASAKELLDDLTRFSRHQPVAARPPTFVYQSFKFARRHRIGMAAAATIVLVVVASLVGLTLQNRRIRQQTRRANLEAATANQVAGFLTGLFSKGDPRFGGASMTVGEAMDLGARRVRSELSEQPVVQARIMATLGRVYISLGQYKKARDLLTDALDVQRRTVGENDIEYADTLLALGNVHNFAREPAEARGCLEAALAIQERVLGAHDPKVAETLSDLGDWYWLADDVPSARAHYERALAIRRERLPPGDVRIAHSLRDLADIDYAELRYAAAIEGYVSAMRVYRTAGGAQSFLVGVTLNNLGQLFLQIRDFTHAQQALEQALGICEKARTKDDPELAGTLNGLGLALLRNGDVTRARVQFERTAELAQPPRLQDTRAVALDGLGAACLALGDLACAEKFLRQALAIYDSAPAAASNRSSTLLHVAALSRARGQLDLAERQIQEVLVDREEFWGPDHPQVAEALEEQAALLLQRGRVAQAREVRDRARSIMDAASALVPEGSLP